MSGFSKNGHRRCVSCGGLYYNSHRTPICGNCREKNAKDASKTKLLKRILVFVAFFFFYLGFLLYFLFKEKKPHFAKPVLYASVAGVCFYTFVYFSQYFI